MMPPMSLSSMRQEKSVRFFAAALLVYIIIHIVYFLLPGLSFQSDSLAYWRWAEVNVQAGTWYPSQGNMQDITIVAPVYINLLVLVLKVWNNVRMVFLLNCLLNLSQLLLVFAVARRLFGTTAAVAAGTLYMLYLNNLGLVLMNLTELAFGVFLLLSFYLYITQQGWAGLVSSGLCLGLAIGIRPTGWVLAMLVGFFALLDGIHKRWNLRKPLLAAAGLSVYVLLAGGYAHSSIGDFTFMSQTGPANLLMTANDDADGRYNDRIFSLSEFQNKNYRDRNKAYLAYALRWIVHHPFRWAAQIPQKLYSTYVTDDFAVSQLLLNQEWSLSRYIKALRHHELNQSFDSLSAAYRVSFLIVNGYHQAFYLTLACLFFAQVLIAWKKKSMTREEMVLYLFILIGAGMTLLGSVGSLRYKYSFVILAIILCSPRVAHWCFARSAIRPDGEEFA